MNYQRKLIEKHPLINPFSNIESSKVTLGDLQKMIDKFNLILDEKVK